MFSRSVSFGLASLPLAMATLAIAPPALAHAPDGDADDAYQVVDVESSTVAHDLVRTVTTIQAGDNPVNRFPVHRVIKRGHSHGSRGVILLIPPISAGFENYEANASGNYEDSFAAYFAERGYDVWGLSQRTATLTAGDCESGVFDCSAMADWGLETLVADAAFVRRQIEAVHHGRRPVVGGVSLGSIGALAIINTDPHAYAGALLMEGTMFDADPGERAIAQGFCDQGNGALAAGVYYDGQQLPGLKAVAGLASFDPSGPSPIPGFPPGLTNHQVFVAVMSTPQVGPLTPRPDYFFLGGDPIQDRFFHADDALARNNIAAFTDYVSLRMVRDIDCGLAGERTHTANLGQFRGPIFLSAGEHGFGRSMLDTAELMPHAHKTVGIFPGYGHMDYFFNVDHKALMEGAIEDWLEDVVFEDDD